MTHKLDIEGQQAPALRPTTYNEASGYDWDIVKAQARCEELTDRDLYARSRAELEARGEYDPAKHGTAAPEPLTVSERLDCWQTARCWPGTTGTRRCSITR
jgi:hypothetical protein